MLFTRSWGLFVFLAAVLSFLATTTQSIPTPFPYDEPQNDAHNIPTGPNANGGNQTLSREQRIQKLNATVYEFLVRHHVTDEIVSSWVSEDAPLLPWLSGLFNTTTSTSEHRNITVPQFAYRFSEEIIENDGDVEEMSDPMFWESAFSMMHEKPEFRAKLETAAEKARNATLMDPNATSSTNSTASPYDKFRVQSPRVNLELEMIGVGELISEHSETNLPGIIGASFNEDTKAFVEKRVQTASGQTGFQAIATSSSQ